MSHFHRENKILFIEAIRNTAKNLGFSEILIEKDYYCSLILKEIFQTEGCNLVFKGGTLLNKVHAGFYRLSEDLDFSIDADSKFSRSKRRELAHIAKECVEKSVKQLSLNIVQPVKGHNENRAYNATVEYDSIVSEYRPTIKIEFTIQESIFEEVENLMAQTILKNPLTQKPVLPDFLVKGLSLKEAYSEKIRAALSRRKEPAIRDFFDIHYAVNNRLVIINNLAPMIQYKLDVLNCTINLSDGRKKELLSQLRTDNLKRVLRRKDFEEFDFEKAWNTLKGIERTINLSREIYSKVTMSDGNYTIELCGESIKYRLTSNGLIVFDIPEGSKLSYSQWQAGLGFYTKNNNGQLQDFKTGENLLSEEIKKSLIESYADNMEGTDSKEQKIALIKSWLGRYPQLKHEAEFWAIVWPLKGVVADIIGI